MTVARIVKRESGGRGGAVVVVRLQSVPLAETSSHLQGAGGLILGRVQISKPEMADPLMTRISLPL